MNDNTLNPDPVQAVLSRLHGVKQVGKDRWQAFCPSHENPPDGHTRSLSVCRGDDGRALIRCHAGCPTSEVMASIGLTMADLFPDGLPPRPRSPGRRTPQKTRQRDGRPRRDKPGRIIALYDYLDALGKLLFQVVRFEPKDFRQRRPDGRGGWLWNLDGVPRVLYRLPDLLAADPAAWVYIVEGEKDVDNLRALGLAATCNPGGKMKWKHFSDDSALDGRRVAIIPDNDADSGGMEHAQDVAARLHGRAAGVRIVELPGDVKDASEWLDSLDSKEPAELAATLVEMAEAAPAWAPEAGPGPVVQPYQAFPVDALPEPVRGFVSAGAKALGCDPSYIALPLLSALGAAIGNTRRVELKRGWREPPILWMAIVGESGTMKSPAMELALRPVRKRQHEAMKEYEAEKERYEQELLRYERDLGDWKRRKDKSDPPRKPEEPVAERYWCDDATVEAMAVLLLKQPRGLLMVRDELSGWLGGFDRYSQGKGCDVGRWLEMFGARPMVVDRKTSGHVYVPMAAVSIAGGIQPGILRSSLGQKHLQNGLAARLLLAWPPRRRKRWTEADIAPEGERALEAVFRRLYGLQGQEDEEGEVQPIEIGLTPEGKRAWIEFYNAHAGEQVELTGSLSAAWSKLEAYAARLALVVHFVRWAGKDPSLVNSEAVDEVSIAAGVTLLRWFKAEARRVYAMFGESEEEREERHLTELIRRKGGSITTRDLMRCSRAYKVAADAEAALEGLARTGLGRWVDQPPGPQGGRPARRLALVDAADVDTTPRNTGKQAGSVNVNTVNGIPDEKGTEEP